MPIARPRSGAAPAAVLVACAAGLLASAAAATTLHVDAAATGAGDGSSWADAYPDLADALATAAAGDVVLVAGGTYRPAPPGGPRTATFPLPEGVTLLGGHAGAAGTDPGLRVPSFYVTILDGDLLGDDLPDFANRADNVLHVVTVATSETTPGPATTLDGVTVRGGQADGSTTAERAGGGLLHTGDSPLVVSDCDFTDNEALAQGGAIDSERELTVLDSTFTGNRLSTTDLVFASGGALDTGPDTTVADSVFVGNRIEVAVFAAGAAGGAIDATVGLVLTGCRFESNVVSGTGNTLGGAVRAGGSNSGTIPLIAGCTFLDNHALGPLAAHGGALRVFGGPVDIVDCVFAGNGTIADSSRGGAVYGEEARLTGCLLTGNTAESDVPDGARGGALYLWRDSDLRHCTVAANHADREAGGLYVPDTSPTFRVRVDNTILWANTEASGATGQDAQISVPEVDDEKYVLVRSSCVQGWDGTIFGSDTIGDDPLLADPDGADDVIGTEDDDVRLSAGSSCIDAGALGLVPADATDLDLDGDVEEKLAADAGQRDRLVDDPATPDTGSGFPPPDIGAHEFGAPLVVGVWDDLGSALAGSLGPPELEGTGTLRAGEPVTLALSAARPAATAFLVVGFSELAAPLKGGILVPSADLVFALPVGADAAITIADTWPAGLPPEAMVFWQWWIVDDAGPAGFAASNGVRSTST